MFTGHRGGAVGIVRSVERDGRRRPARGGGARSTLEGSEIGASVAVNGVCLTVVALAPDGFAFEVGPETLARTTLGGLRAGTSREPRATAPLRRPRSAATSSWATSTAWEPWRP